MVLPVSPLQPLSVLNGQSNGKLPSSILVKIPGQSGGATITLVAPAARAFKALIGTARRAGHILKTNTPSHSYRTYAQQVAIFTTNYTTTYLPGRPYKYWNGRRWYQKYGLPVVALPGRSNHGWGRAVDMGEERDGDLASEMFDNATLNWLIANEQRFGISHEIQSEIWHLRYFAGDRPPAAVLAWESGQTPPAPKPEPEPQPEDEDMRLIVKGNASDAWWITDGITKRHINDRNEAGQLAFAGLAKWDPNYDDAATGKGGPFVVPQSFVDDITTVPRGKTLT